LDHPLDMKLGGPPMPMNLLPLDPKVNGAFGSFARNVGDKLGAGNKLDKVSLVCPPSSPGCPGENHSVGTAAPIAPTEWKTTYSPS
jgi:hypothetical protein